MAVLDLLCPNVGTAAGWDRHRRARKAAGGLCVAVYREPGGRRSWMMKADTFTAPDDGHLPAAWPIMTDIVEALAHRHQWPDETGIGSVPYLTIPWLSDPIEGQVIGAAWQEAWFGNLDGLSRTRDLLAGS